MSNHPATNAPVSRPKAGKLKAKVKDEKADFSSLTFA
jgi:hypothetical protein